jgi:hypothetical protein
LEEVVEAFEEVVPHVQEDELALEKSLLDLESIFGVF